jgi:hypothetical protein
MDGPLFPYLVGWIITRSAAHRMGRASIVPQGRNGSLHTVHAIRLGHILVPLL